MYDELIRRLRNRAGAFDYDGRPDIACDYEQAADAIEEVSKPRWIPVEERLPEKYGTYLVTTKRGSVMVGCYYPRAKNWNIRATAAYWMPLPEPPKEEE